MDFIYSADLFLLKQQVAKILTQNQVPEWEIESFSFIENSLPTILQAMQTPSLFNEQKTLILNDCWFVTETKTALHKTFKTDLLIRYLKAGINPQVKLIFTLNSDRLSKRLKITEWFKNNTQIKFLPPLNEITMQKLIQERFAQTQKTISASAIEYLIANLPMEMQVLDQEVKKLLQLSKNIDLEDVQQNLTKYLVQDIFEISDAFLKNDLAKFLKQYQNYRLMNNDHLPLLALLGNNLAILRNALLWKKQNLTTEQIAQKMGINAYRLKLLFQANNSNIQQLNDKIIALYEINKNLVLGKVDQHIIPEYEFIKILK